MYELQQLGLAILLCLEMLTKMYYICGSFFWDFAQFPRISCSFTSPSYAIVITGKAGEILRRVVAY